MKLFPVRIRIVAAAALLGLMASTAPADGAPPRTLILVTGAPGNDEYGRQFAGWAAIWEKTLNAMECRRIGPTGTNAAASTTDEHDDKAELKKLLESLAPVPDRELWLVLIGHGTFDGREAKMNLRGPDLGAAELGQMMKPFSGPQVIVNLASASAPFLQTLSAKNRVVITATRSGNEQNFARFGEYFSSAITNQNSDLDRDGQTSLLEAFLSGAAGTADFYRREGRLATEHPLIDDNGDALGTPSDWFRGLRAIKKPEKGLADGSRAHQFQLVLSPDELALAPEVRARRNELELQLAQLRDRKAEMDETVYLGSLEKILLEIARLYEALPVKTSAR